MDSKKLYTKRILAIAILALGLVFGVTLRGSRFCLGDRIFTAVGLPAWSNGTTGTHYPGILGLALILIGIGLMNTTLSKKARLWMEIAFVSLLVLSGLAYAYL